MLVILYVMKFCLLFLLDFYSLEYVDSQNNYTIQLMKQFVFEAL